MGGGEPDESVGDASRQMHGHDALDEWFERSSTYVGEGSEDGRDSETQISCKPVTSRPPFTNFENFGQNSAVMYQGIQTVDLGGDKKSTSERNQGIYNSLDIGLKSQHWPMDIDYYGSKVSSREPSVRIPGCQAVEQEAVVPAASNRMYSLMQIKLDKQDLSLVEKVTLLQRDIYNLCNRVVPTSVVHNLGQDKYQINFSQLNNSCLRIVGFYGNKNVMMDISRTNHIVDHSTLRLMERGELKPGLYSSLRQQTLHLFYWDQGSSTMSPASRKICEKKYVKKGLVKLRAEKAKNFSGLAITLRTQALETWLKLFTDENQDKLVPMGRWIQLLMCLVPIQIARAENNGLKPLVDGLQIPSNVSYADALSLAGMIRFGFYEFMLESWVGEIKVISSMGKQSSGKSYLLNHLSGSLLDVAGGRCTDGVWMTMRPSRECLYVLLDFEGLGSFERSEQEDMLLSIFNAAVSNITIFNKKDFHFDKETEAVFEKFQGGVSLVKADPKLFQGLFYIAIKDVDTSDVEDLKTEFQEKILQICKKSKQNFLTSMYGGEVEIAAMPLFQRPEYHDSIKEIAATMQELGSSHENGLSFMRDLKLVLAQISTKDWSPIDSKRVAFKISLLRKHWETAISMSCLAADDNESVAGLINFDTGELISDLTPLQVGNHNILNLQDTGVRLAPPENQAIEMVLKRLRALFQNEFPGDGENDEAWHSSFESFLVALAGRRKERVLEWMLANSSDFEQDGDVQKLRVEAVAMLSSLQHRLSLCSCKCPRCFLRCIQERSHPGDHSCRSDHKCTQRCTYCADDILMSPDSANAGHMISRCSDSAGHQGPHDCQEKAHTCSLDCSYWGSASNCNRACTKKVKHTGDHKCNSRQHMCQSICSLPRCNNPCVIPFDLGEHDFHACHEKICPPKCRIQGCQQNCASKDHFHSEVPGLRHHFCGDEHSCHEQCEAHGICEILTEVVKKTRTCQGNRGNFDYELVSEQNGIRKTCCIAIPSNQRLEPSIEIVSDSNLGGFFYETVYDAASIIDYSKKPLDAGVVDSPPPKKICRHSPSPSPLKGIEHNGFWAPPSRPVGVVAPQRRLRMEARPAKSGPLHIPLHDALPVQANSDASAPRAKVASNPKRPRSDASIEFERYNSMRRNQRQSTSLYLNSSPYHSGGRRNPKCVMVGPHPKQGYSRAAEIFRNVEAMRTKELAVKEKEAISKAR